MLTPEERKAHKEWREAQMSEDEKLLRRAKQKAYQRKRAKLLRERKIINGWNK